MIKFSIINKLAIVVILGIFSLAISLGIYFDGYLKDTYFKEAKKKIELFFATLIDDVHKIEENLKSGISFVQTDENFLASVDLVNSYQNKQNYNHILLDEEKKILVSKLLDKVKLSLNDGIIVYDKNQELIAYVLKQDDKYIQNFVSFENTKAILKEKSEDKEDFVNKNIDKLNLSYTHKSLYRSSNIKDLKLITYHFDKDENLTIKSHFNITDENKNIVAYVEMFKKLDKKFFTLLSQSKDINVEIKEEKTKIKNVDGNNLSDINLLKQLSIKQNEEFYYSKIWIKADDKNIFIEANLQKDILLKALNEIRLEMLLIIVVIVFVMLLILRYFFNDLLAKPFEILMKQIGKIEKHDYSNSEIIKSNDELGVVSENINNLAVALNFREKELEAIYDNLLHSSNHDPLTELSNRRYFVEQLEQAILNCQKNSKKLALLFVDLDHFKNINDTLGHNIGDILLKLVAQRLLNKVQNNGVVGRFGGDEFVILIDKFENEKFIKNLSTKIIESLQQKFKVLDYKLSISASIGISMFPNDGNSTIELIKHADLSMYYAKEHGRNNFCFFSKELENNLEDKTKTIDALKEAIEDFSEFSLVYQPKFCTKTNKIVSIESLIRWNSKSLGYVYPSKFISIAEETNMIVPIGEWILKQACSDFQKLLEEGYDLEHVSINVSPIQLHDKKFFQVLNRVIVQTKIDTKNIELEITEGFIATDTKLALEILNKIKDMGISLAIDDFGTGYSSLSYLKKLPISRLKIDKSFVDDLPNSQESVAIAKAIISLAKTFDLAITAEGVENKEQLDFLKQEGCDEIQGYYFSKPISFEELKQKL